MMSGTSIPLLAFRVCICIAIILCGSVCGTIGSVAVTKSGFMALTLDYTTPADPVLQAELEALDIRLRAKHGMTAAQSAVGVLDLRTGRLAMLHPDRIEYAASVPKIGILLAYFQTHPEAAGAMDPQTGHELGLMIKTSSHELAAKYSRQLGLAKVRDVLESYGLYDKDHGGGIWMGKHYGQGTERVGDPLADHSHAATVRQLLRFYLLLEQGRLVSPEASKTMREIFASSEIPHQETKFVKALRGKEGVQVLRKSGSWLDWLHDTAVVIGPKRHYILVALTRHPSGDEYLTDLAAAMDALLAESAAAEQGAGAPPRVR